MLLHSRKICKIYQTLISRNPCSVTNVITFRISLSQGRSQKTHFWSKCEYIQ